MDPQLKSQCRQTIWVATLASRSSSGDPTFAAATSMKCRCEDDVEDADSADGQKKITRKRIVTESKINLTDRVWLPGVDRNDSTLGRSPLKVQELPDERGVIDHYETII